MQENKNIQESVLFDDSVSYINSSSNGSNIVHKKRVTSIHNNTKIIPKNKFSSLNRNYIMASQV